MQNSTADGMMMTKNDVMSPRYPMTKASTSVNIWKTQLRIDAQYLDDCASEEFMMLGQRSKVMGPHSANTS